MPIVNFDILLTLKESSGDTNGVSIWSNIIDQLYPALHTRSLKGWLQPNRDVRGPKQLMKRMRSIQLPFLCVWWWTRDDSELRRDARAEINGSDSLQGQTSGVKINRAQHPRNLQLELKRPLSGYVWVQRHKSVLSGSISNGIHNLRRWMNPSEGLDGNQSECWSLKLLTSLQRIFYFFELDSIVVH